MDTPTPDDWPPERIRDLRTRLGLTQQQLADRIGYRLARSVSDLEGRRADGEPRARPSLAVVVALEALDDGPCARVVELWSDEDAEPMQVAARYRLRADWPEMGEALDALSETGSVQKMVPGAIPVDGDGV